ncbi:MULTISPECIES: nucleotide exchange factor GrpE [Ectothiorhodospira]|uniref:Protein GrpE n=1 Tax=Ectothiorhodospira marina TaxID=1396821 RepID=A0A1H7F4D0_9GAMM|nr:MULTISPECIES: nucleotide exchange factor GrpE [Ectothiorhodospira]MCG5514858.1 nucleotide exchange factor GrpE [Ectothiorhodospira sp. 9100]MCG5517588.1 nucleotide exchange factor GrpE [Ectothiorhodospira sp. 9905]SEK19152.1 molecular chaperone GrpE [Ectothiorhodospira marina]
MANDEHKEDAQAAEDTAPTQEQQTEFNPATLLKQLEESQNEAREYWDKLVRSQAELENLRKRMKRDVEQAHKYALEKFAGELLPVRDSLEMGLDAAQGEADVNKIREGTELTLKMLVQAMSKHGVQELNPEGERFDPEQHQAMSMQENAELEPNTVITVMQKGYILNDRLLRPAMVIVSRAPASEPPASQDPNAG